MTDSIDLAMLLARACLAAVFLYSALDKIMHRGDAIAELEMFKLAPALRWPVIAVQLAGGLSVLLGIYTGPGALLLAGFTIVATLIAHKFWIGSGPPQRRQMTIALEHLAIVGGLLLLAAVGPGRFSLDRMPIL
jgi:putative oxidoreductase